MKLIASTGASAPSARSSDGDRVAASFMPIGRFSRSCRLSIKALRHYDQLGLLKPAYVDRETGYRYYEPAQARIAVAISMLRALEVPLATIRRVLDGDEEEITRLLDGERQKMERELAKRQIALATIDRLVRERSLLPYEVKTRNEPERSMCSMSMVTSADKLVPETTELVYRFFETLQTNGIPIADPIIGRMQIGDSDDHLRFDILAPIPKDRSNLPLGVQRDDLVSWPVAYTTHRGAYEVLGLAHHAVFAWVQEHGHEPRGEILEVYLNDPRTVPAEELLTEVLLPID